MRFNIFDLLLPRETKFYDYMNQQVDFLVQGCHTFKQLVDCIETLSEEEIRKRLNVIKECESKGDAMEAKLITELSRTFITPLDREDIHTLSINVDRALDILNSISRKVDIYHIRQVHPNVRKFAELIVRIAEQATVLMKSLEKKQDIDKIASTMHHIENETDELFHTSMAELFNGTHSPIEIIKFKEFYEHLESVVDAIDYIGKIVRGIVVKQG
jgi:hypothetical protein